MEHDNQPDAVICNFCGKAFTLPEDEVEGNLPRVLICGHIFCTSCLQSIESRNVVRCPECEPADLEAIERAVDQALATAAERLAKLEHLHETLTTGLAEQVKRERARLAMEINLAADKALYATQKWREVELSQLNKLEAHFSSSQAQVYSIKEQITSLTNAMHKAKKVFRVPFLKEYCDLDKILETLQAPVDHQSFSTKCLTMSSGLSVIFRSFHEAQSVALSMKIDKIKPEPLPVMAAPHYQDGDVTRCAEALTGTQHSRSRPKSPQKPGRRSPSYRRSSPSPPRRSNLFCPNSSVSRQSTPDVVIEELIVEEEQNIVPPTGPELANDKRRTRKRGNVFDSGRNVNQLVVVTHVVNPCHFYVHYVAEKWESDLLSKKINNFCARDDSYFTFSDRVESGSVIFAKGKEDLWCRASVLEVYQNNCEKMVKVCPVFQLASVQVFFMDYGFTKNINVEREVASPGPSVNNLNNQLRKVNEAVYAELSRFCPQAIRCSFKDLVPYDLTKGWSQEAQVEFCRIVGSAAVEMHPLGQDKDFLLVDLKKAPMDQCSDVAISVREYLVFVEVARFYCAVKTGRRPLKYYPAVYPQILTKHNGVVSHISSPGDFYIQLADGMESLLLLTKLQDCYNAEVPAGEDHLLIYCPVIGQACVARFEDTLWYRAEVIGHPGGRKVEVRYTDFGNQATVLVSDLRKIKDEFFSLPALAIHCCLADVLPLSGETWSEGCISRFVSLVHHKLFVVVATEKSPKSKPLPVKLYENDETDSSADIAEVLIAEQLACSKDGFKSSDTEVPVNDGAIWDPPLDASGGNATECFDLKSQLSLSKSLTDLKVRVTHVSSPSSFYVHLAQSDAQLNRLSELLKEACELLEPEAAAWKPDMTCAAHINGVWERGQICSDVTSSSCVEVKRCDHGNKVKLDVNNLRPLPSSLAGSFALECSLTDVRPAGGQLTWTATACDFMSNYLSGASTLITIQDLRDQRPSPVTLHCTNKMGDLVNFTDFLASKGLALKERKAAAKKAHEESSSAVKTPPSPAYSLTPMPPVSSALTQAVAPRPAMRTIRPTEKVKTELYKAPELPCLGHNHMTISAIKEDGLIYARTQNADCQLEQLRDKIQQSMKTLPNQKRYTWKTVKGCAVIGPDMLWYRGQMLEVTGGNVKVQYVDYGLVENIPVVHVYPRLLCEHVPQLCMACRLHAISPVGGSWQQDAVELLKEMLLYRRVDVHVLEVPADPRQPLTVEIFIDGLSLNDILCHHKHALKDSTKLKTPPLPPAVSILDVWDIDTEGLEGLEEVMLGPFTEPTLPQEDELLKVRVRHLQTPNELFLCMEDTTKLAVDGETLEELLSNINANTESLRELSNFPLGGPCLAEYSNGSFYRAKIIDIISSDPVMILVQHVDFGSYDTLPTSKLRQMPAELLRFPVQVFKVHAAGFKAPNVGVEDEVLPYSPEWSVKATLAMIQLLHGNLTASVVTRVPELSVLLYNDDDNLVFLSLVESGLAELD
ncbi:RING finger protein 17 isoform X2 [Nerophis ophidion]|uniref:RING finger protein 17 isoform X2 n=1 Tax=Nerophis ophidion TaxID=159077 RepID=UPI002AE01F25|nr:RING finger protein 17 isoform X2 [Nerophis ophidion]